MSLFASAQQGGDGGGGAPRASPYIVDFKAGKMTVNGTTVTASTEKGMLFMKKTDGLLSLNWRNRGTGAEDDPIILFPGDAEFKRCKSCPNGRVYFLQFVSGRREFYWMQEPDSSKDEEFCLRINNAINGITTAPSGGEPQDSGLDPIMEQELAQMEQMFPDASREELIQIITGDAAPALAAEAPRTPAVGGQDGPVVTPMATEPETPAGVANTPQEAPGAPAPRQTSQRAQVFDDNMMRGIMAGLASEVSQGQEVGPNLSDILTPDNLEPILADSAALERLLPFIPQSDGVSVDDIRANIRSPQYAQALQTFDMALQSGQLSSIMSQFGVDASAVAAAGGGVTGLLKAIQQQVNANAGSSGEQMDTTQE